MNPSKKVLGKGKFGRVIELKDRNGNNIAFKIVDPGSLRFVEIDILTRIKSPYLVRSLDPIVRKYKGQDGIVMEMKEDNLEDPKLKSLPPGQKKRIIMSLLYGTKCMHSSGFLHLDIKPKNCLYDSTDGIYTGYLSDFGFSARVEDAYTGIVKKNITGTLKYFPYEFLEKKSNYNYTDKNDVWSLGVTILMFLGFNFKLNFSISESREEKKQRVKEFWDSGEVTSMIDQVLEESDFSEIDKMDLQEMLFSMLQKESDKRISSRDFEKLRFFKNNQIEDSCYVSKPKEVLFIPYSSSNVMIGINKLNDYFRDVYPDAPIEVYFLAIETFTRLMAISPMEISKETLELEIQKSFFTAMRYYDKVKINFGSLMKLYKESYQLVSDLKGDMGANRYFYGTDRIEDLILLREVVLKNYNLICFYNYLDVESLYNYFRQNYNYSNIPKERVSTFREMMEISIPGKNSDRMIEDDRGIFSYKNIVQGVRKSEESVTHIDKIRDVEKTFRESLLDQIRNLDNDRIDDSRKFTIKRIRDCDDLLRLYKEIFKGENNLYEVVMENFAELDFCYIREDIFGNLIKTGNEESKYFIFFSDGVYSLVYNSSATNLATHYFSKHSEKLEEYFKERGHEYQINYDLRTSSVCKINQICLLFLIYFSQKTGDTNFNMIYVEDKTIKSVLSYYTIFR